jgi:hypothetical protein
MDERHWWIAERVSQTYFIDSSSNILENFICEPNNLDIINLFLCMGGSNKLFFHGNKEDKRKNQSSPPVITIYDNLLKIPANQLDLSLSSPRTISETTTINNTTDQTDASSTTNNSTEMTILYMIRHDTMQEVSLNQIHKEVFCGEIKNANQILYNVYNDMLMPIFETNKNWSKCNETNRSQIMKNMKKYINSISEYSIDRQNVKKLVKI